MSDDSQTVAVLDDYDGSIAALSCWDDLRERFTVEFPAAPVSRAALSRYDVIVTVRERTQMSRAFIAAATSLKHLALTGRLSGQADLEALRERGIAVSYTDGSGPAAAELTIALLLGLAKNVAANDQAMRHGGWQTGPATTLAGKTLGVLGLGRIGAQVAQCGSLLGMHVVSWGPTEDNGRSSTYGVERMSLDDVLRRSDFVAVSLRLSEKTRGLLTAEKLAILKDGASIINTARADIIVRDALYDELARGRLHGAFDVFYKEPLPLDDPMRTFSNVLLSPHMGYVTHEVYRTFFTQVVENVLAWKDGCAYKDALAPL